MLIPPSFAIQEERLRGRATETEEVIQKRLEKAKREIAQLDAYDYIVYNYNGGSAVAADDIKAIVRAEKLAQHRQPDAEKKYFEN
jgi:guanylate kinase